MKQPAEHGRDKAADSIQQRLTSYACELNYAGLSPEAIHAAKVRVIYTFGALIGGYFGEPSRIARNLAARMLNADGATVIGTRMKTTPDMAALVNGTTARLVELTDAYPWPGSPGGHPTDVIMPVLAAAEHAQVTGREFITAIVLAYEVFLRINDVFHNPGFDTTNFACLGTAAAAGKLLRLSPEQFSHCLSMAVVPNNILRQVRRGHLSMFKAVAAGHAGRAGVFAALLARAGMEGPHLPFEGKAGWCDHVALKRFSLNTLGGSGTRFKILDTRVKPRPAAALTISSILAAEKIAPINVKDVQQVTVEFYRPLKDSRDVKPGNVEVSKYGKDIAGTSELAWNPNSREAADHSIPYLVAATLMDGTVTLRSYDDAHLSNREMIALMQKIRVVENPEFIKAYEQLPVKHYTRITVVTNGGERLVGKAGGDQDDLSVPMSDTQIAEQFREITEEFLGAKQVQAILERLWHLEEMANVAEIPPAFVLD